MTRHRTLRLLALSLTAAAVWFLAPAEAAADHDRDRDRHGRYDHRDHDRGDRWDRGDRRDRRHDRHRFDRHARHDQYERYDRHDYRPWDRRFARHRSDHRRPAFYCNDHRHGFHSRDRFQDHLVRHHHVPFWYLPRLVANVGFGWTYGH